MLHPLPTPDPFTPPLIDVIAETAEIDLTPPVAPNVDGTLHVGLPLSESHAELLELVERLRAVLLVHGAAMIGDRVSELLDDCERAIRKGRGLR
jgi:hypothetical protein